MDVNHKIILYLLTELYWGGVGQWISCRCRSRSNNDFWFCYCCCYCFWAGQRCIAGQPEQCRNLVALLSSNANLAGVVAPHFTPSTPNPSADAIDAFLDSYRLVTSLSKNESDLLLVLLTKVIPTYLWCRRFPSPIGRIRSWYLIILHFKSDRWALDLLVTWNRSGCHWILEREKKDIHICGFYIYIWLNLNWNLPGCIKKRLIESWLPAAVWDLMWNLHCSLTFAGGWIVTNAEPRIDPGSWRWSPQLWTATGWSQLKDPSLSTRFVSMASFIHFRLFFVFVLGFFVWILNWLSEMNWWWVESQIPFLFCLSGQVERRHWQQIVSHNFPEQYHRALELLLKSSETQSSSALLWCDLINTLGQGYLNLTVDTPPELFRQQVLHYTTQQNLLDINQVLVLLLSFCRLFVGWFPSWSSRPSWSSLCGCSALCPAASRRLIYLQTRLLGLSLADRESFKRFSWLCWTW